MRSGWLEVLLATALVLGIGACASPVEIWSECDGLCDESFAVPRVSVPELIVNDLGVLDELDREAFSLAAHLGAKGNSAANMATTSQLYRQLSEAVAADVLDVDNGDSAAGVGTSRPHRLFDVHWLESSAARFRLVAIVNRIDLAFATSPACGEVRFVYRLMYTSSAGSSRLPMTIMVVREQQPLEASCAEVARAWTEAGGRLDRLRTGPLASLGPPVRIETNLQRVRWPVGARTDLGGHAEYSMRVFEVDEQGLRSAPLPNTIRTDLGADEAAALATWIRDNIDGIDRGIARVPDEFLATRVISVSPRGLARAANRPFLQVFPAPETSFADIDFAAMSLVKSPGGLLRRLDTMSCQGCHQSRGLAGFHVLGEEDETAPRNNAIEVGTSPHLNDELSWRRQHLDRIAGGASSEDDWRPFAERVDGIAGVYGAHCGLGDPSFASWTCASGFVCADLNGEEVGMCVSVDGAGAGDACEVSTVTFDADSHRDRVENMETIACKVPSGSASCSRSGTDFGGRGGGFPNGACTGSCNTMGQVGGDAICGPSPPAGFNECILAGRPFTECLDGTRTAFRRRCDSQTPCGDDYVCIGVPGAPSGVGACMPPYFTFQARVDGHIVPD